MILGVQQSLKADGVEVSMSQLCRWFEVTPGELCTTGRVKPRQRFRNGFRSQLRP